jgi:hypothetical protein
MAFYMGVCAGHPAKRRIRVFVRFIAAAQEPWDVCITAPLAALSHEEWWWHVYETMASANI